MVPARVGCNHFISNNPEWNNVSFISQTPNVWLLQLNFINFHLNYHIKRPDDDVP